ncbi:Alpha/Beta hydrolase protein [Irpex lacteus]|nr:Alpha/Beta hydrolase protein [Irpex lacteus]
MSRTLQASALVLALLPSVFSHNNKLDNTHPHAYKGMPTGDYSTEWQSFFKVRSDLPNVSFDVGTSYAGNIAVQRENHPNNTLFFWGFESQKDSLTAAAGEMNDKPWAIWLQGGPGTSSLYGLFSENGPILMKPGTETLEANEYAWSNLVDYIWIDQPVGVGFSTADAEGYAADETQVAQDFVGFLDNLVKVFPSLATRPFHLTGESYAGRYISYISSALFAMENPPVKLAKLAMGNPALGSNAAFKTLPSLSLLKTYPQIIDYNSEVYDYFANQAHLCGLDINLTYPQTGGYFPSVNLTAGEDLLPGSNSTNDNPDDRGRGRGGSQQSKRDFSSVPGVTFFDEVAARYERGGAPYSPRSVKRSAKTGLKLHLNGRPINTVDPYYGCYIWDELTDFALNYTYPWSKYDSFDTFDVPDALSPDLTTSPTWYLNQVSVRESLHAPDKAWSAGFDYPWGNNADGSDPSPEPMTFMTDLATNASSKGVPIVLFVGNDDATSPHFGTEVTIQNTTFGGTQGFTVQPGTPWYDDQGNWAGVVHQERNWTYVLVYGAGHEVPAYKPAASYVMLREFILGSNQTGLVTTNGNTTSVVGGQNPTLQQDAIPGQEAIYYGSSKTEGSTAAPSATVAMFESHVGILPVTGTEAIAARATNAGDSNGSSTSGAERVSLPGALHISAALFTVFVAYVL